MIKTSDFSYTLPEELIAATPLPDRTASRLLCLDRRNGTIVHRHFRDLPLLLNPGDLIVMNDTRVIPARIYCSKANGIAIELLFTRRINECIWEAIAKPARRLKPGTTITLNANPSMGLSIRDVLPDGSRLISPVESSETTLDALLEQYGQIPLPPYIKRESTEEDRARYQTVYAREQGAVAAPTAGLHFSKELLAELAGKNIQTAFLTLHVGVGTFRPVATENPLDHHMHSERFSIPPETVTAIHTAKQDQKRVIAIGTTVVRALEHAAMAEGGLAASSGETSIFIMPGHRFQTIDALVTNFHLPRSTLLMLVCAFAGHEHAMGAYAAAVQEWYRFYSYGDAMYIG